MRVTFKNKFVSNKCLPHQWKNTYECCKWNGINNNVGVGNSEIKCLITHSDKLKNVASFFMQSSLFSSAYAHSPLCFG